MPLPLILAGVAAVAGAAVAGTAIVGAQENSGINAGKKKAVKKARKKINRIIDEEVKKYRIKAWWHFCLAVACFVVFCINWIWLSFNPLTWLIAIIVSFASMNLLAETIVLLLKDTVKGFMKGFTKGFWKSWNVEKALKCAIYHSIKASSMKRIVGSGVNRYLDNLSRAEKLAYDIFGRNRSDIAEKIYIGALNKINYTDIIDRMKYSIGQVFLVTLTYTTIAFLLRIGIVELSSFGWLKWMALWSVFFGVCFWWHKQRL